MKWGVSFPQIFIDFGLAVLWAVFEGIGLVCLFQLLVGDGVYRYKSAVNSSYRYLQGRFRYNDTVLYYKDQASSIVI